MKKSSRMKPALMLTTAKSKRRDQIRSAKNFPDRWALRSSPIELNTKHKRVGVARKAVKK